LHFSHSHAHDLPSLCAGAAAATTAGLSPAAADAYIKHSTVVHRSHYDVKIVRGTVNKLKTELSTFQMERRNAALAAGKEPSAALDREFPALKPSSKWYF
jgi:hypothetical protein